MNWQEAYEQIMRERDIAMQAKAIKDEAEADLRERLQNEITHKVIKELQNGRA